MLWKTRGGYFAIIKFNPDIDLREFGSQYGPGMFTAVYKFRVTNEGRWTADFDFKFEQVDNIFDDRLPPPEGRKGPFYAQDYSRVQSNTAKRARILAKPAWDLEEGRSGQDFSDLLNEEKFLNETIDWSFKYHYRGTGDWSNFSEYEVDVSNTKRDSLPQKDTMTNDEVQTISISSIKKKPIAPV